jgi:hypothetical protein
VGFRSIILVLAFCGVLAASCTVTKLPKYEYTSATPEVSRLYRWRIEAEPYFQSVNMLGHTRSTSDPDATQQFLDYGAQWVDSVQARLAADDHFQFYDNPPVDGVIHLTFYGQLNPTGTAQTAGALKSTLTPPNPNLKTEMLHEEPSFGSTEIRNRIDSVDVVLLSSDGRNIGQIKLARVDTRWGGRDEISARRVADAIRRVVNGK